MTKTALWRIFECLVAIIFLMTIGVMPSTAPFPLSPPTPPTQPPEGPGGSNYSSHTVITEVFGIDADQYFIFTPADPVPASAPVIVFNHGWIATDPVVYQAWINHLVKRGNIVIYPVYQTPNRWLYPPDKITPNAIAAVQKAIAYLQGNGTITPDLSRFAIVGHSAGGIITANMAALAATEGLPVPKALMSVEPGISKLIPLGNLSTIPNDALLLSVAADQDKIAGNNDARLIFLQTPQISLENKDYITLVTDVYGRPGLRANHMTPIGLVRMGSSITCNAQDFYGLWKLFDGLCDAAFYDTDREYALGNTTQQRFMGLWSDGTPVHELLVTDNP